MHAAIMTIRNTTEDIKSRPIYRLIRPTFLLLFTPLTPYAFVQFPCNRAIMHIVNDRPYSSQIPTQETKRSTTANMRALKLAGMRRRGGLRGFRRTAARATATIVIVLLLSTLLAGLRLRGRWARVRSLSRS